MALGLAVRLGQGLLGLARAGRGVVGKGLSKGRNLLDDVLARPSTQQGLASLAGGASRGKNVLKDSAGNIIKGYGAKPGELIFSKGKLVSGGLATNTGQAAKILADDIANIFNTIAKSGTGRASAQKVAQAKEFIRQRGRELGIDLTALSTSLGNAINTGRGFTTAQINKLIAAAPPATQTGFRKGSQLLRNMGDRIANSRIAVATNPNVPNAAADAAFNSVLASGRNMMGSVGSGISNQFNRLRSGIGSFGGPNPMTGFGGRFTMGGPNAAGGAYAQPGLMSQMRSGLGSFANRFKRTPSSASASVGVPNVAGQIASNFTPMGALRATGRGLKGIGSFAYRHPFISTGLGTAGIMYGPDAYDALTTKTPEQQLRQGVQSLVGTEENRERSIRDLAALYAQGELGNAIGTPGARNLAQQQMRQYVGGSIFGDEGYANIPMRGGSGMLGGEGMSTMSGDIFNNPARESIMKSFGMQMDDEEIIEKYSEILDKQRRKKSLNADDIRFLMMFEALNKPSNLPTDVFSRNAGFESARARQDVQNQLGGQFEVLDYNELYPTYAQPQTAINAASGGEASGPGTGTSDSIPARLSDGEFVMTAKAVRGAGDGDRKEGVRKMYALMNSLEGR